MASLIASCPLSLRTLLEGGQAAARAALPGSGRISLTGESRGLSARRPPGLGKRWVWRLEPCLWGWESLEGRPLSRSGRWEARPTAAGGRRLIKTAGRGVFVSWQMPNHGALGAQPLVRAHGWSLWFYWVLGRAAGCCEVQTQPPPRRAAVGTRALAASNRGQWCRPRFPNRFQTTALSRERAVCPLVGRGTGLLLPVSLL